MRGVEKIDQSTSEHQREKMVSKINFYKINFLLGVLSSCIIVQIVIVPVYSQELTDTSNYYTGNSPSIGIGVGKSYSGNYNKYYSPVVPAPSSPNSFQKVYNGQQISRDASVSSSYAAPETGVGGGGDLSSSYGAPSSEYGAASGGYAGGGGGGGGQMYHYSIIPAAAASQQYGAIDDDDDDDDDDDEGGGLLGGGATQALCIAKLIGLKGKKIKLIKKVKKLKKILKFIKFAPIILPLLLPILLPLLLIPIALLLLLPIPVLTPGRASIGRILPQSQSIDSENEIVSSRAFDGKYSNYTITSSTSTSSPLSSAFSAFVPKISEYLLKSVLEREECVERISCELSQGTESLLGKGIGHTVKNKVRDWTKRSLGGSSLVFKRISTAGEKMGSCEKFKCKPVNAMQNYLF